MSQLYVMSQPYLSHIDHKLIVFRVAPSLLLSLDYNLYQSEGTRLTGRTTDMTLHLGLHPSRLWEKILVGFHLKKNDITVSSSE